MKNYYFFIYCSIDTDIGLLSRSVYAIPGTILLSSDPPVSTHVCVLHFQTCFISTQQLRALHFPFPCASFEVLTSWLNVGKVLASLPSQKLTEQEKRFLIIEIVDTFILISFVLESSIMHPRRLLWMWRKKLKWLHCFITSIIMISTLIKSITHC